MNEYKLIIDDEYEEYEGVRLDKALSELLEPTVSRSFIRRLIDNGEVYVNGSSRKASYPLSPGDTLTLTVPDAKAYEATPENIPLDILYEDEDVIVVNKPKGMVVHPAAGHMTGTLVNALMYHCGDSLSGINGILRPGIVHRIDKDTSGSLIACKNDMAHASIASQLREHSMERTYRAICLGELSEKDITIDAAIARHKEDRKRMAINPSGKSAVTHVHMLEGYGDSSYIECRLETGRTHQIRVHMESIRHPLLGDEVYYRGRQASGRLLRLDTCGQALHAYKLGFMHPHTGKYIETVAPLPGYMVSALDKLREI